MMPLQSGHHHSPVQAASHQLGDIAIPVLSLTLKEVNWVHLVVLSATPLISLVAFFLVPMQFNTMAFAFFWIHRYWSHRSYEATIPYQIVLALAGAGAVQGSIRWWSRGHRAHHRYTDTPKDPYMLARAYLVASGLAPSQD
ncbi:hypothetical protein BASA83_013688 [Batrachochytrium salamandrivorans]|nr:hypothetical protein BASA83_013688 [Batrachochytrium salamandrivorans]